MDHVTQRPEPRRCVALAFPTFNAYNRGALVVARMSMFSRKFALALVMAMLGLGAPALHAQAAAVNYWIPGWPMGFSGAAGESPSAYGSFPSFDYRDLGNGSSLSLIHI